MAAVPRHQFVDSALVGQASEDTSLPIGLGPPLSTPSVVARMIELARAAGKPVLIDPKGSDYSRYAGATAITPNRNELALVAGAWEAEGFFPQLQPGGQAGGRWLNFTAAPLRDRQAYRQAVGVLLVQRPPLPPRRSGAR